MSSKVNSVDTYLQAIREFNQQQAKEAEEAAAKVAAENAAKERDRQIDENFKTSKEKAILIAKKALVSNHHSENSFLRIEFPLEKGKIHVFYKDNHNAEVNCEVKLTNRTDVEQVEAYRLNKLAYDQKHANDLSCIVM